MYQFGHSYPATGNTLKQHVESTQKSNMLMSDFDVGNKWIFVITIFQRHYPKLAYVINTKETWKHFLYGLKYTRNSKWTTKGS